MHLPQVRPPPNWCDAHHVRHWADGGHTTLTNLTLLCAHHHTWVHQRDLTATITTTESPGTPDPLMTVGIHEPRCYGLAVD